MSKAYPPFTPYPRDSCTFATNFGNPRAAVVAQLTVAKGVRSVAAGEISMIGVPHSYAIRGKAAAGYTTPEVPTTTTTSAIIIHCSANSHSRCGSDSPNHTTPGRTGLWHSGHSGGVNRATG